MIAVVAAVDVAMNLRRVIVFVSLWFLPSLPGKPRRGGSAAYRSMHLDRHTASGVCWSQFNCADEGASRGAS